MNHFGRSKADAGPSQESKTKLFREDIFYAFSSSKTTTTLEIYQSNITKHLRGVKITLAILFERC